MPLRYIKSGRGTKILVHQNYLFHRKSVHDFRVYWRCILYGPFCRGRICVEDEKKVEITEHSHLPNEALVKSREAIGEKKCEERANRNNSGKSKKRVNNCHISRSNNN